MTRKEKKGEIQMTEVWLLGAADPEMQTIESLLKVNGRHVAYALNANGERVRPDEAYTAYTKDELVNQIATTGRGTIFLVECRLVNYNGGTIIDHHNPGDPGYGKPPKEFLEASSIGQVLRVLNKEPTPDILLIAAADHCLGAAYKGLCPGVNPDELMKWRVVSRAAYQKKKPAAIMTAIESARATLRAAPLIQLTAGISVRDMRGIDAPELPEAAAREGTCFVSSIPYKGRTKYVCQSGSVEEIEAFIEWAKKNGLENIYGDPTRGFAGGYK